MSDQQRIDALVNIAYELRDERDELREKHASAMAVLREVYDEVRGGARHYSADSYLPAHLVAKLAETLSAEHMRSGS